MLVWLPTQVSNVPGTQLRGVAGTRPRILQQEPPTQQIDAMFWGSLAFILILIALASGFGWMKYRQGGCVWSSSAGGTSDEQYRQVVLRRRELEQQKRMVPPSQRQRRLIESFRRCRVHKIVMLEDFVGFSSDSSSDSRDMADERESRPISIQLTESTSDSSDTSNVSMMFREVATHDSSSADDKNDCTRCHFTVRGEVNSPQVDETETALTEKSSMCAPSAAEKEVGGIDLDVFGDDCDRAYLQLTPFRRAPNCCVICLASYQVGDRVVWSSNPSCLHAFHLNCILDWLVKMQQGTPCPCCRQEFTDLVSHRRERRITWRAGSTFDPQRISLR